MLRGTTPTHTFNFGTLNPSELSVLNAYYAQHGDIILEKEKSDFSFDSNIIDGVTTYTARVTLTQEETKKFSAKSDVEIQLRVLTIDNTAMATPKYKVPVHDVLNDEVLENET